MPDILVQFTPSRPDDVGRPGPPTLALRWADHPAEVSVAAEVGAEIVLLNMATGYIHELNSVGSYLWRRLAEPSTVSELCRSALDDFEADQGVCRRDVDAFVQELHEAGLVGIE